jgi:hypothetical protein
MNKANSQKEYSFSIHLIWVCGPKSNPEMRILWVSDWSPSVVYEGVSSLATCIYWINYLSYICDQSFDFAAFRKYFEKNRFITIKNINVSLRYIESLGFLRADE